MNDELDSRPERLLALVGGIWYTLVPFQAWQGGVGYPTSYYIEGSFVIYDPPQVERGLQDGSIIRLQLGEVKAA